MEHLSEILKRQSQANLSKANTKSSARPETEEEPAEQVCPICKGVRFVHPLLSSGKTDFSQVVPCRCAEQGADEKRQNRLQRYSNLGSLTRLTFASLNPRGNSKELINQGQFHRTFEAASAFARQPKGWFVLSGPSGCGKTHLAAGIGNHCIENSKPVFYITTPDLLDHLRSSFNPDSETTYDEFFEQVRNTTLLILDDFGMQSGTAWAKEQLDQLLNHRFNNQLPTVIVSIVPIAELEDRIRTRLVDSELCQIHEISSSKATLPTLKWGDEFKLQKEMTFENFDWKRVNLPLEQRRNLEDAYSLALQFAKSPDGWLVLMGDNGCGKTHLAAAIVNFQYKNKKPALFIVVPDFLDHLRSTFSPESKTSYDQYFESVKGTPLLILDDFGAQTTSSWAQEKLYQVINHRYNARLPSVITTNCSLEEIENRISSRLADTKISVSFNIIAPHYRADRQGTRRKSKISSKGQEEQ